MPKNGDCMSESSDLLPCNCEQCNDKGKKDGCPECGLWPWPHCPQKVINNVTYFLISTTYEDGATHERFKELQRTNKAKLIFEPAATRYHASRSDVMIWVAEEDFNKEEIMNAFNPPPRVSPDYN